MDHYFTFTALLGLRDGNLPLYRQQREQRMKSVKKMVELIQFARNLAPKVPVDGFYLDPFNKQWDDLMPFPVIAWKKYFEYSLGIGGLLWFYSYNYNLFTHNIRFRSMKWLLPLVVFYISSRAYFQYTRQVLKINLFDQYCWLRAQELAKQNQYLLYIQGRNSINKDYKKLIWFEQDFKETMYRIYRQSYYNQPYDFKDSELIVQDFINRYVDPNGPNPMKIKQKDIL